MFLLYHCVPCGTNVFIVPLCTLRPKMLETFDPEGVRCGILGKFVPPRDDGLVFFLDKTSTSLKVSIYEASYPVTLFWIRIYRIFRIKDDVAVLRGVVIFMNLFIVWNFVDAIIAAAKITEKVFISIKTIQPPVTTFYLILKILKILIQDQLLANTKMNTCQKNGKR